eukprot:3864623-Pleurochrysis_carterae.AAC.7
MLGLCVDLVAYIAHAGGCKHAYTAQLRHHGQARGSRSRMRLNIQTHATRNLLMHSNTVSAHQACSLKRGECGDGMRCDA